ncbi:cupin domain-containing protein [Aeoliella mucimassa]|uniref:Cupin domain protein n=1 Tax=Aeoliella mucimassa TaxID=2527972 RepID=A0A518AKL6_9BACT|nr:cupin domain-containing protein [Aeoliella mucimassa]QDU55270.1 Cupin domain protein [Aeoliella mucimassa]
MTNLFQAIPTELPEELVTVLAESNSVRIERIVSTGQASAEGFWYDQAEHEWVAVLAGDATLEFADGEMLDLRPGDQVLIAAHRKHRVARTSTTEPTVWLAVFFAD